MRGPACRGAQPITRVRGGSRALPRGGVSASSARRHRRPRRGGVARDHPRHPCPPVLPGGAGLQPEVHRQGADAAGRPGLPRPRGRVRAAGQARRPQDDRGGVERGRLGRPAPRGAGQRLDHRVDLPRRHRGRGGRRREPGRDHAAEGADAAAGRGPGPAADPDREDHGLRGRQDRDRGADRERAGADQRRTRSPRRRRGWRRSSSARPTSWPRST